MKVRILIDSVDVTGALLAQEWSLSRNDGGEISTVEATFFETSTPLSIEANDDFVVEDFSDATVRLFGGIVVDIQDIPNGLDRNLKVLAQDWKLIADRSIFSADYRNQTDLAIIQDAFAKAEVTEINLVTYTESARIIEALTFRGATLRQMLDTVSQVTGYVWDIDPFKKLIYRPEDRIFASFHFSDQPDNVLSFPYHGFSREIELGAYNAIEVHGKKVSTDLTITASGDGVQTIFHLYTIVEQVSALKDTEIITRPPEGQTRVVVQKNIGTDGVPNWAAQSVGLEGESGKDVIWSPATSRLEFAVAPPNLTKSWRIQGSYISSAFGKAVTPGVTRVYARVLTDDNIDTNEAAQDLADAFLRDVGNKDRVTLEAEKDGLVPGTSTYVANAKRWVGLKRFKVHAIVMRLRGAEVFHYKVTLGAGSHSFAHLIAELRQKAGRLSIPEGEAITQIRRIDFLARDTRSIQVTLPSNAGVSRSSPYTVTSPAIADLNVYVAFATLQAALGTTSSYVGYSKAS